MVQENDWKDSFDLIESMASSDWCNHVLGTTALSYAGRNQWVAAS